MIRKITASDYLKRLDNMSSEERQKYNERAGEWLRSKAAQKMTAHQNDPASQLQNVMLASTGWNDNECQAFEEGALLMTAVAHSEETWLPDMLYTKTAKRVIRRMVEIIKKVCAVAAMDAVSFRKAVIPTPETKPAGNEKSAEGHKTYVVPASGANVVSPNAKSTTVTQMVDPARPRHIDQYIHLLPEKTREHAAEVRDLLRELDLSREKLRLLMDDDTASAADRETWAKKVTAIDNKLRSIYNELDSEWDKLVKEGRVVLDDLGNAHIVESPADDAKSETQEPEAQDPEPQSEEQPEEQKPETQTEPEKPELTAEQRVRRKNLRKWLCDTRYGNGDKRAEYVKRWKDNFKQYLLIEGNAAYGDEKIQAAAEHYGIDMKKLKIKKK